MDKEYSHFQAEHHFQEFFVANSHYSISVGIFIPESRSQSLENYTKLNKIIEINSSSMSSIELLDQQADEAIR